MPTQIKILVETGWKCSEALLLMFYNWTQMFETCLLYKTLYYFSDYLMDDYQSKNNLLILYVGTKDACVSVRIAITSQIFFFCPCSINKKKWFIH